MTRNSPTAAAGGRRTTSANEQLDTAVLISTLLDLSGAAQADPKAAKFSIGALWNLAERPDLCVKLVKSGAIRLLLEFLRGDNEEAQADAVAALHTIAAGNPQFVNDTAEKPEGLDLLVGLVPLANSPLFATRFRTAAMLLKLSGDARCATHMCGCGAVEALADLATTESDRETKMRCVAAIANAALVPESRQQLASSRKVVHCLVRIGSIPDEGLRVICASALCAISHQPGTGAALVAGGAHNAVKVMSLVASDNPRTRLLCVRTMVNLFNEGGVQGELIDRDIIWALGTLAAQTGEHEHLSCISDAFASLSALPAAMAPMTHRNVAAGLLALLSAGHVGVSRGAVLALYNLSVPLLDRIEAQTPAAVAAMDQLVSAAVVQHLTGLLASGDMVVRDAATCTLCALACGSPASQRLVLGARLLELLTMALELDPSENVRRAIERAATALASSEEHREAAMDGGVLALAGLLHGDCREADVACAQTLLALSADGALASRLVPSSIDMLTALINADNGTDELCAGVLYNLSRVEGQQVEGAMVACGVVKLLQQLFFSATGSQACKRFVSFALVNLCQGRVNSNRVIAEGSPVALVQHLLDAVPVRPEPRLNCPGASVDPVSGYDVDPGLLRERHLIATAVHALVKPRANRLRLIEAGLGRAINRLAAEAAAWCDSRTLLVATSTIEALAAIEAGRTQLVADGLSSTIISLSSVSHALPSVIRANISACLSSLASHATTSTASANRGFVKALLGLSEKIDDAKVARTTLVRSFELPPGWEAERAPRSTGLPQAAVNPAITELGIRPVALRRHDFSNDPLDFPVEKPAAMTEPVPPSLEGTCVTFPKVPVAKFVLKDDPEAVIQACEPEVELPPVHAAAAAIKKKRVSSGSSSGTATPLQLKTTSKVRRETAMSLSSPRSPLLPGRGLLPGP